MDNAALHPMMRPDWIAPSPPEGFDQLCALELPDGEVDLDYVSHERRDFASETMDVEITSPWLGGFEPQAADWERAGFYFLSAKPCPYQKAR